MRSFKNNFIYHIIKFIPDFICVVHIKRMNLVSRKICKFKTENKTFQNRKKQFYMQDKIDKFGISNEILYV